METKGSEKSNPDSLKRAMEAIAEMLMSATALIRRAIGKQPLLKIQCLLRLR